MTKIVKTDIVLPNKADQRKIAFVLENVFTSAECKKLINLGKKKGYIPAEINVSRTESVVATDYRKSGRCLIDTPEIAANIFKRIREYLPEKFKGDKLIELNERLRFLKYTPGDFFLPHHDGTYVRPDGKKKGHRSHITIILYLNENCYGGQTRFVAEEPGVDIEYDINTETYGVDVIPKTGSVLVFQHDLLHQGVLLESGVKYIIRSDVMFYPNSKVVHY